jgi:hypothetical protein
MAVEKIVNRVFVDAGFFRPSRDFQPALFDEAAQNLSAFIGRSLHPPMLTDGLAYPGMKNCLRGIS